MDGEQSGKVERDVRVCKKIAQLTKVVCKLQMLNEDLKQDAQQLSAGQARCAAEHAQRIAELQRDVCCKQRELAHANSSHDKLRADHEVKCAGYQEENRTVQKSIFALRHSQKLLMQENKSISLAMESLDGQVKSEVKRVLQIVEEQLSQGDRDREAREREHAAQQVPLLPIATGSSH
jgi:hypothetical protein